MLDSKLMEFYNNEIENGYTKLNLEKSKEAISRGAERTKVREHPRSYKDNIANFSNSASIPHYIGHRKRVKERFVASGAANFSDYELLEIILFSAIPRKDVKPLAKKLLDNFKTITDLINLDKDRLLSIKGTNENLYINFAIVRELINRVLKQKIINKNIISSWASLIDYLKINMGNMRLEQFRVLFLNKKNILIADEILSQGTIDQAAVYPREIIKRALFNEASSIILVHNHPSGSPEPSKSDIDTTNKIVETCQTVNIVSTRSRNYK